MKYQIITILTEGIEPDWPGIQLQGVLGLPNVDNKLSPASLYNDGLAFSSKADICIFIHNDVTVHDPAWINGIITAMSDPNTVAVGLGGALGLGSKDLYRKPYDIWQLARNNYMSNQTDAETHGVRYTGISRVAVLDAFCMAVRRDFLDDVGGWPEKHLTHHCLDLWLACEAARQGRDIYMVGALCTHHGGGSSTKPSYASAPWLQGGTMELDHQLPHRWIYEEYRDVLPLEVQFGVNGC